MSKWPVYTRRSRPSAVAAAAAGRMDCSRHQAELAAAEPPFGASWAAVVELLAALGPPLVAVAAAAGSVAATLGSPTDVEAAAGDSCCTLGAVGLVAAAAKGPLRRPLDH